MSNNFMNEYIKLGHMTQLNLFQEKKDGSNPYYIPYISIIRKNALATKLRNVFNDSMKSSNGISLIQTMWEG